MVCILQSADLPVQFSNLSRERVDLLDGLGNIKIQIALLLAKIVGRVVKAVCEVACGGENRLAQRQACGIPSKLAEAAEEVRNLRADVAAAAGKVNFDLLHAGDECVQLPLLLGLFLNAQLQNGVAQALQVLQEYLSPWLKVRRDFGRSRRRTERAHGFTKRPLAVGVKLEFVAIRGDYCRLSLFQLASQLLHQRQSLLERTKRETGLGIHDSKPGAITPCHPIDA